MGHAPVGDVLVVAGGRPLTGTVTVPGDKSISHRALLLAAVAEGTSEVRGLSDGDDVHRTAEAVRALGATVDGPARVSGGPDRLRAPSGPLDLGNSGTTIRLLAGLVAGWDWPVVLAGDASLSTRPMDRVAVPLRLMGATVDRPRRALPPAHRRPGRGAARHRLHPAHGQRPGEVVRLAGGAARRGGDGRARAGPHPAPHRGDAGPAAGPRSPRRTPVGTHVVRLRPGDLVPFDLDVPGDPSQAAFWVVAACIVPGSEITVERVYIGPARRGFLDVLVRMGADIDESGGRPAPATWPPRPRIRARHGPLRATDGGGGRDHRPRRGAGAGRGRGGGRGHHRLLGRGGAAGEGVGPAGGGGRAGAAPSGARPEAEGDDLVVRGRRRRCRAGEFDAAGDHRMAMAAAVAAAAGGGPRAPSRISGRVGGHQLPALRRASGPRWSAAEPGTARDQGRGHRRTGRGGQVDAGPGRGRAPGARAARHRGDVPGRGLVTPSTAVSTRDDTDGGGRAGPAPRHRGG